MKLRVRIGEQALTARLAEGETAKDFAKLLPLTLKMNDLFKREKFANLPRALSDAGKHTDRYALGEIGYWPPGPDLAIFYRHDGEKIPAPGIIVIGKLGTAVRAFDVPGTVTATFELFD